MLSFLALACKPPDETTTDRPPVTDGTDTVAPPTGSTGSTGDTGPTATGDTGSTTIPPDCTNLPMEPVPFTAIDIVTTEDFDFDALGDLIYSDWTQVMAVDINLNYQPIGPGVFDTRGIQILEDGNIVANYISDGAVGLIDRTTGGGTPLITGLSGPNALEVGDGNVIFVSEAFTSNPNVRSWDLDTMEVTNIANGFTYPNGLALGPNQDVLYVTDSTSGVYRVPKNADGTWGAKELLFNPPGGESYDGIETDVCGNVYTVNFYDGQLFRFNPETHERVLLADINDPAEFLYNSIRWGSDRGGWRRDVLYVTDRHKIFAVEVGIEGRRQPVDAMP
jgi:hypothetical protein